MQQKNDIVNSVLPLNTRQQFSSTDRSNQQYNYQFYEEYKKIYQTTTSLSSQMKILVKRKQQAWDKLSKLQKRAEQFRDDIRGEPPQRKKRSRRTADQIQRQFKCDQQRCNKSYGTEGSLYQHIKLKHPKEYELKKKKKQIPMSEQFISNSQKLESSD